MIKFLEEYNQSPHDYAYWLTFTRESASAYATPLVKVYFNKHKTECSIEGHPVLQHKLQALRIQ